MSEKDRNEVVRAFRAATFLKIGGIAVAVPLVASPRVLQAAGEPVEVHGPYKAKVTPEHQRQAAQSRSSIRG